MVSGKSVDVRKTEKYMNDACSAALSYLHKAAQKKGSHIWCEKFESLNRVFRDEKKPKTNNVYERNNCAKKKSKICWTYTIDSGDTKTDDINESDNSDEETCVGDQKLEWRVTKANSKDKTGDTQNVYNFQYDYKMKSYHHSLNALNISRESNVHQEPSSENIPESATRRESMPEYNVTAFRQRSLSHSSEETQRRTDPIKNIGWRTNKGKDVVEKRTIKSRGYSQVKHPSHIKDNARRPLHQTSPLTNHKKNNRYSAKQDGDNSSEVRYQETSKNHSSRDSSVHNNITLRSKRTRCDSESSSDSRVPLQKKQLGSHELRKASSSDIRESFLESMVSVKIIQNTQWHEFIISLSNFNRIRKKYPKLSEVLPQIDSKETEFQYCYDVMKTIFGYLFQPPYNYTMMPGGKVAVEVLAAAKTWDILQFHEIFLNHFLKNITVNNCATIYSHARYFGLWEVCDACQTVVSDKVSLNKELNERFVRSRKCSVLVDTYVEPIEYLIPLENANKDFEDFFDKDIRNTITFEALANDCCITGFGILLDADSYNRERSAIDIFYTVKIMHGISEEIKQSKPLRSNIVIHFKKKIDVKEGQKLQISVEISIKPSMCFSSKEEFLEENNASGVEFRVQINSTYKVGNSNEKRFFIGKLLYNALSATD